MAETNAINLKVFLRDEGSSEAKRFTVDASVVTSYLFMKEKLQVVFPNLKNTTFKITWKDSDNDEITIASDEDFITAFTEMNSPVKVLYVTIVQHDSDPVIVADIDINVQEPQYPGRRIICDICDQIITGFRYKCLQCPDYDLCNTCEYHGHHSDHVMIRVPNQDVYMPKCARKFMHHVAKNLKKSAHAANKEAYKASKLAHKYGSYGKCGAEKATRDQADASCSSQEPKKSSCPFVSEEGISISDIHQLGAMARQHFAPVLDVLRNQTATTGEDSNEGLFMDVIRNAVDGFFGKPSETATKSESTPQKTDEPAVTPQVIPQSETPMDLENSTGPKEPTNQVQEQEKREPGWTFVPSNTPSETKYPVVPNEVPEANAVNHPTAPVGIHHENPRIAEGLLQLHEMGFSNESGYLTHLLQRYDANINEVVKAIIEMRI